MLYINNLKEEKSILLLKNEAILAAVDEELIKVLDNIVDTKTDATKTRRIRIDLSIEPAASRDSFELSADIGSQLAPKNALQISLDLSKTAEGDYTIQEEMNEAPGQADIFGGEIEGSDIAFVPRQIRGPRPGDQA